MPAEVTQPSRFADLPLTPAYPTWVKPEPADRPVKHRKTYTFVRSIMAAWDRMVEAATSAAYCHGASTAPDDALDELGITYGGLARALGEDNLRYRRYLRGPLSRWYRFGTRAGLLGELAHLGYPNAEIVTWRDLVDAGAAAPNVVFSGQTTFFFVAILKPNSFDAKSTLWLTSGAQWKTSEVVWAGAAGIPKYLDELRRVIAMVKPAHTSCRHIVVFNDSASGLNAQKLPTGNYGVYPMNEPWERPRPSFAFNPFHIYSALVP